MTDKIHFIINVIIYFMNFTAIICLMYIVSFDKVYFELSQQIFLNWDLGSIIQIQIQQATPCDQGMEIMLSDSFPGIDGGCDCFGIMSIQDDSIFENKITSGSCSLNAINAGCQVIRGIYKNNYTLIYNKTICVKRNRELNYKNIYQKDMIYDLSDNISSEKKSCGEIDTVGNILLVAINESCPYLFNNTSDDYDYVEEESDLSKIDIEKHRINTTFLHTMSTTQKFTGNYNDISTIQTTFYDDPITLYNRNYIGWKIKCKQYFSDMYIIPILSMNIMQLSPMYLISSLFVLFYCLLFIMICKEVTEQHLLAEAFLICIHLTLIIFVFEMIIKDYIILFKCVKLLKTVIDKGCSDIETIILLISLYDTCSQLELLYFETITLFGFMIPLSLFKFGLIVYRWYKEYLISLVLFRMPVMEFEMTLL